MKKFIILSVFVSSMLFGAININEATRYELMTIGKLDAGRSDVLIAYRNSRQITSVKDLQAIMWFKDFNTSNLENAFEFKELVLESKEEPKKKEKRDTIVIREKETTRVMPNFGYYEKKQKFGNIEITEKNYYPTDKPNRQKFKSDKGFDNKDDDFMHYRNQNEHQEFHNQKSPPYRKNHDIGSNVEVHGEIRLRFSKDL